MKTYLKSITTTLTLLCLLIPVQAAEDGPKQPIPDLTKGEKLTRMNSRWVGPLGIHCGTWRQRQRTTDELPYIRQLLVLEVDKGSPSEGILEVGDVILGFDGTGAAQVPLSKGSETWELMPIADAINDAEARNPALLKLLVWRPAKIKPAKDPNVLKGPSLDDLEIDGLEPLKDLKPSPKKKPAKKAGPKALGKTKTVTIKLQYLGSYSDTAPYNCPKSKAILRKGIKALYEENKLDKAGLGILCLLAADDPTNPDNDKYQAKAKEWAHQLEPEGSPWFVGPKLMALSEYYMKTKDETILPKLAALAEYHAKGVSWFGTCGHRYSEPAPDGSVNGRIAGYGPITASGTLGYLGLSMARQAGVNSPAVEKSHEAQRKFFGHFALKSGMGYGEMPYGIGGGTDDYNAKQANSGLALGMDKGKEKESKYFSKMATLSSLGKRQYAHGGSFFGQVFHPIGAVQGGEKAAHMQFDEIRGDLDIKRRWDNTRIYDATGNAYTEHHHSATGLIFYAAPLKQIYLTGRGQKDSLKFTDAEFQELVEVKNFDASKLTNKELLAVMSRYDGMLRGDIANELANRVKAKPDAPEGPVLIDKLLAIAANENNSTHARVGASCALMYIKHKSKDPVKSMKNAEIAKTMAGLLKDPEAYIRFAGVRVLQKLAPADVRPHVNTLMDAIIATGRPTFPLSEEDPLQWAHGEMGSLLINSALKDGLDGIDRDKLIPAIRSLLKTPNGGARGAITAILPQLNKEETLKVSDLLVDNIQISPPGNAMGGGAAALNSQKALANHFFAEAMALSVTYGPAAAIKSKVPQKFGKAALGMSSARQIMETAGEHILVNALDAQALIDGILKGEAPKELNSLKRIDSITAADPILKLPATETKLVAKATNFASPAEGQTTYTWRKVYGAGKVSFSPNASSQSKVTTVTFTDKKPGKYRFELEMTDELGLTVLRDTVLVILNDSSGKLPRNQAPQVKSKSLKAMPGYPLRVIFSGSDPDGDHLGCTVTQLPAHGVLTAVDGRRIEKLAAVDGPITYTADFGYEGKDQLSFLALDGQGKSAKGKIEFKVSAAKVPVVVYEGFEYPSDKVHGKEGGSSFGFGGPWINSRGASSDRYRVHRASLENPGKTASITYPNLPSRDGRLTGGSHTTVSRYLDIELLAKHGLLKPGGELWFSAYVDGPGGMFSLAGPNTNFGFAVTSKQCIVYNVLNGKRVGEVNQAWSRSAGLRFSENEPALIVGQCIWGKTDEEPDTVKLFRVFNAPVFGPMLIDKPAAVMHEVIAQEKLNAILLNIAKDRAIDEIRIGTSAASVMQGTVPMK